jgi:hypothetical protein
MSMKSMPNELAVRTSLSIISTYTRDHNEKASKNLENIPCENQSVAAGLVGLPFGPLVVEPHQTGEGNAEPGAKQRANDTKKSRENGHSAGDDIRNDDDNEHGAKPVDPVLHSVLCEIRRTLQRSNEHPLCWQMRVDN